MKRLLLIVEDSPDELKALVKFFVGRGFLVLGVAHPRRALEAATFRQFQVALLDESLPEMDGTELMQRLKRTQDAVQCIIFSGHDVPTPAGNADGAFAFLTKPYRMAQLEALVENALEQGMDENLAYGDDIKDGSSVTPRVERCGRWITHSSFSN